MSGYGSTAGGYMYRLQQKQQEVDFLRERLKAYQIRAERDAKWAELWKRAAKKERALRAIPIVLEVLVDHVDDR